MTSTRSHARPSCGERQAGRTAVLGVVWLVAFGLFAGSAHATEIELVRPAVEPPPPVSATIAAGTVDTRIGFDSFPAHLLSVHAPPAQRSPAAARPTGAAEQAAPLDARTLTGVLGLPELSPLEMEQPMRFYENDVLVKFRAPGGRSSFATVELIF